MVHAFNPMTCPNLAVPAEVTQRVVQVESGANPFAIGVVGGRLERQPRNLGEAIATARMLESKGYDYSLGIAQVNRSNLVHYGLDTFPKAFDGCANLAAGAQILAECYGRSGGDWSKAFSCYYSGNFTTGYRDGYVQRVYAALDASVAGVAEPIVVYPQTRKRPSDTPARRFSKPGTSAYRASIRSVALDSAEGALASVVTHATASPSGANVAPASRPITKAEIAETPNSPSDAIFKPRVSGPVDAPVAGPGLAGSASPGNSAASVTVSQAPATAQEMPDAAFVF